MNSKYKRFINKKNKEFQYYKEVKLKDINKPITVLLGPNGTGKSMSLRTIEYELEKKKINVLKYSTSKDDIVQKGAPAFGDWDISKVAMAFTSEGERMTSSFFDWCTEDLLRAVKTTDGPIWALVDEADSGLSIDRLIHTMAQFLWFIVSRHKEGRDIHAVLTCNSWEMLEQFYSEGAKDYVDIIWVPTKERIHPNNYDEFSKPYIEYFNGIFREEYDE